MRDKRYHPYLLVLAFQLLDQFGTSLFAERPINSHHIDMRKTPEHPDAFLGRVSREHIMFGALQKKFASRQPLRWFRLDNQKS